MSIRISSWWMAVALTVAVGCGGHGVVVQSPQSVGAVPGNPVQTEQAILAALPRRGWRAQSVEPGRIVAFIDSGGHGLRVDIRHDPQQIAIYYVDSSNLAARIEPTGHVYAHSKVNTWIRNLSMDIAASVSMLSQPAGAVAPLPAQRDPSAGPTAPQTPAAAQPTAPVPTAPAK